MLNKKTTKAFTLVELLVVISIIALLLAVLMPTLQKARAQAMRIVCGSGLKQQGIGFTLYASDSNNKYPHRMHPGHWPHGAQSWYDGSPGGVLSPGATNYGNPKYLAGHAQLLYSGYFKDPEIMFCGAAKVVPIVWTETPSS